MVFSKEVKFYLILAKQELNKMASYILALFIFIVTALLVAGIILLLVRDLIQKAENNAIAGVELLATQLVPRFDFTDTANQTRFTQFRACSGLDKLL
jgi:hypothetical protein